MPREKSKSASNVRLYHRYSDPLRRTNSCPTVDATLLVPQPSNTAPLDSALSALVLNKPTFVKASLAKRRSIRRDYCRLQPPQLSRALAILSKYSQFRKPAVGASAPQLAIVVVEPRESKPDRAHTPLKNAVLDQINYSGLLRTTVGAVCESFERVGLVPSRCISFVSFAFRSSRWFRCYCIAPAPRRARESATSVISSTVTVSLVSVSAKAVIVDCAQFLPISRSPICVAAVLDAIDVAVYFLIVFECRCCNRVGRHGSRDTVESRIEPALHRDIGYQNPRIFRRCRVISHAQ